MAVFVKTDEDNRQESYDNLCIDGHLAPEFFLLGAQKAATTSFSIMLADPRLVFPRVLPGERALGPQAGQNLTKELHTFDGPEYLKGKEFWLSHYPECNADTYKTRQIAVDMTPGYLRSAACVPGRIQQFYGHHSHRIKFASILRNPVSRIHSVFHFYETGHGTPWKMPHCEEYISRGFTSYVQKFINGDDPCKFLSDSEYHKQFESFMAFFNASQFLTIPMLEVVAPPNGATSSGANVAVLESLGVHAKPAEITHLNAYSHSSLEEVLGKTSFEELQSYVDKRVDATKVAKVHVHYGIKMYGYDGPQDVAALAEYLKRSW